MTKSNEIQIGNHMETNFLWKIAKSRPFEAKGFLNNYVFSITNKESPLMKDDLGSVWGPTQRTPKNFRKKKIESEKSTKSGKSHTYTRCIACRKAAKSKNKADGK